MGSRQIVLVSTAGFSVLNTGIFWREAKTKRLFSQCMAQGCRTDSPAYVAWRAGTDSLYLPFSMTAAQSENTKGIICTTVAGQKSSA